MMETVLDSPEPAVLQRRRLTDHKVETNWTIAMSVNVDADARRLFQALTLPEYLEAWIRMPGQMECSRVVASPDPGGFLLNQYCAGHRAVSIKGSYLFCHQRKMRLSWRKTTDPLCAESVVDFRLRGNFASSILELKHMALSSAAELIWHQRLWQGSLKKLASLLRST
jgi:uncharacterized protein YndB with AHSA1/START domain